MTYIMIGVNAMAAVWLWKVSNIHFNNKDNFPGWFCLVASAANAAGMASAIF